MKNAKKVEVGGIPPSSVSRVKKKIVGTPKKKNDAEKYAKWNEILKKIEKKIK